MTIPTPSLFYRCLLQDFALLLCPFALAVACGAGCDGDDKDKDDARAPGASVDDGCARGGLEDDALEADLANDRAVPLLAASARWQGRGVDPATGALAPGNYVMASTYIRQKLDPQTDEPLQELSEGVIRAMLESPGLVAFSVASSESCKSSRTFTVWESEEAMYEFVSSGAHAAAMPVFGRFSRGGGGFTHWSGGEADATWARAAEELGKEAPID